MMVEINALKREKKALILAHNYQIPAVQDVADYIGDSLGLARYGQKADAETIIMTASVADLPAAGIVNVEMETLAVA